MECFQPRALVWSVWLFCFLACQAAPTPRYVLLSGSRDWLNYRHTSNAVAVYTSLLSRDIPPRHVSLLLADTTWCDPRNSAPGEIAWSPDDHTKHATPPQIFAHGADVSTASFLALLTGAHGGSARRGSALALRGLEGVRASSPPPMVIFMTGHGGDRFLKLHDQEDLLAADLAAAVASMHAQKRFSRLLIVLDTCQAHTLCEELRTPGVLCIASSVKGQSSYALHADRFLGVHVVDEFSAHLAAYLRDSGPQETLGSMVGHLSRATRTSSVRVRADLFGEPLADVPLSEFFPAVATAHAS